MPAASKAKAAKKLACRSRATTWVETVSALNPQAAQGALLELGRQVRVRANRAGDLAHGDFLTGSREPQPAALDLRQVTGEHDAEAHRLGADAV